MCWKVSSPGRLKSLAGTALAKPEADGAQRWRIEVHKPDDTTLEISACGRHYSLLRRLKMDGGVVRARDTLSNTAGEPVGVLIRNSLTGPLSFDQTFAPGGAENPSLYLTSKNDRLAILIEDDIGRHRYEPGCGLPVNQVSIRYVDLALDTGKSLSLDWSIYALDKQGDYLDFINRVRRDWKSNFQILGNFEFFDIMSHAAMLEDPAKLRAFLDRKPLGLVALVPWLDYDSQSQPKSLAAS